jgi:predicted lipoprotein with Yx(FWY)xxD motif
VTQEPRPPGIGTRLTLEGLVYVNGKGMTLYWRSPTCGAARSVLVRPINSEGDTSLHVEVPASRSCLEKNPPLLAPANAKPVGKWTVAPFGDSMQQWLYDGRPLSTSIKDKVPGDVNGSYATTLARDDSNTAIAPYVGLPAGVKVRDTASGLAFTDYTGKALYFQSNGAAACSGNCLRTWIPFLAPALASTKDLSKDWSVVNGQWAYKRQPLYTYALDAAKNGEQVFADTFGGTWRPVIDGWNVALLRPAVGRPAGVTVQTLPGDNELFSFSLPKVVYANAKGMTLYTMHCKIDAVDEAKHALGEACDDIGDDPRYWLTYCGGEERCTKTWIPFRVAADAKPIGNAWSIMTIDPRNPFQPPEPGKGERVWAYRGHLVFTYAQDVLPGDFYGDDHGFGTTGDGQMQARPIPAYAHAPIGKPVVTGSAAAAMLNKN